MADCYQCKMIEYPEGRVLVDYLYVDNTRLNVQVVTKVINHVPKCVQDVPLFHTDIYDAVQYPRATSTECILQPVAMFPDPFRRGVHKMVLCEVMKDLATPAGLNTRHTLTNVANQVVDLEPWMGFEQEFVFKGKYFSEREWFLKTNSVENQVGVVSKTSLERHMMEAHLAACIYAGLNVYGMNREMMESQWEYQLGPSDPLTLADHTCVSRYLLARIAEMHDVYVTFSPKEADFKYTSSLHMSFSTKAMREDGGIGLIHEALDKLSKLPQEKLLCHFDRNDGNDNKLRLDKIFPDAFTIRLGDKQGSVRIPLTVLINGKGYFEERRPSSDCDPYSLICVYLKVLLLDENL